MNIRHIGIYVKNIKQAHEILLKLGFELVYSENEILDGIETNVKKYLYKEEEKEGKQKEFTLELIQSKQPVANNFHICIDGPIPGFLKEYNVIKGNPFNKDLLVDFVFTNDSIYFEFVRNKKDGCNSLK